MSERSDAVVVGGGLAGLSAATYLARAGLAVEVLERSETPGGRARTRRQDGFAFNVGPHALYRKGMGAGVLRELGVAVDGAMPAGPYKALKGARLETLPVTPGTLLTSRLLPLRAKLEVARWYATLGRLDARAYARTSTADWLARELPRPEARAFAETVVRVATYAADMERHSAESVIRQLQAARAGVLYLHGGWQTLVDGLRDGLTRLGVSVRAREEVVSVKAAARGFEVALADGRVLEAGAVVLALPPDAARRIVGTPVAALEQAAAAVPVRASCLDVALARLPRPDRAVVLGVDRPLYFSVHSAVARLAPAGGALVHAARYLDSSPAEPAAVERELEELLDRVQPGWREVTLRRRFLPELVVSNALVTAAQGGLGGRPAVEVPEVPGLYLAGDWVGAEGLLADASLASARRAAHALLTRARARSAA
jgi:phytoene dehydrogenase-like protein